MGSQFSGPTNIYNLSPQSPTVNRNEGNRSITVDWFRTECDAARFLKKGGNRYVNWTVDMTYVGTSNRPDEYHLQVIFQDDDNPEHTHWPDDGYFYGPVDAHIRNTFYGEGKVKSLQLFGLNIQYSI